jgi:hypothetical protein
VLEKKKMHGMYEQTNGTCVCVYVCVVKICARRFACFFPSWGQQRLKINSEQQKCSCHVLRVLYRLIFRLHDSFLKRESVAGVYKVQHKLLTMDS